MQKSFFQEIKTNYICGKLSVQMDFILYIGSWPFDKFLGFVFFLVMALVGFWGLTFLASIVPYWLTYGVAENYGKINADVKPEEVKRKTLPEQDGIEVVFSKSK